MCFFHITFRKVKEVPRLCNYVIHYSSNDALADHVAIIYVIMPFREIDFFPFSHFFKSYIIYVIMHECIIYNYELYIIILFLFRYFNTNLLETTDNQ